MTRVSTPKACQSLRGSACPAAVRPRGIPCCQPRIWTKRNEAVHRASSRNTAVPCRPATQVAPATSSGPTTKPLLPPTEKMLMPAPLRLPETRLA